METVEKNEGFDRVLTVGFSGERKRLGDFTGEEVKATGEACHVVAKCMVILPDDASRERFIRAVAKFAEVDEAAVEMFIEDHVDVDVDW